MCVSQKPTENYRRSMNKVHMIDQGPRLSTSDLDPWEEVRDRPKPNEDLEPIQIGYSLRKFTVIRRSLSQQIKEDLIELLMENANLFA